MDHESPFILKLVIIGTMMIAGIVIGSRSGEHYYEIGQTLGMTIFLTVLIACITIAFYINKHYE